ncbi:reverse transcriptase [Plakobranchus ocellatus]|uniref:Reverse transcriptase n=1 Tax=Plakobranchus ocellatus TaxID=259542 RepID=A0AAV4CZG8_9GAST|nr:reverse transcriptase [Plakobranchus ocellatus]
MRHESLQEKAEGNTNGKAAQTEKKSEEADESNTCRRTDRSTSTVARFEVEAFTFKQSRIYTKRGSEALEQTSVGLQAIDKCSLPEKYKVWCLQFMLISKLLWPLLDEISSSTVKSTEAKINRFTRKWLGIPRRLTNAQFQSEREEGYREKATSKELTRLAIAEGQSGVSKEGRRKEGRLQSSPTRDSEAGRRLAGAACQKATPCLADNNKRVPVPVYAFV